MLTFGDTRITRSHITGSVWRDAKPEFAYNVQIGIFLGHGRRGQTGASFLIQLLYEPGERDNDWGGVQRLDAWDIRFTTDSIGAEALCRHRGLRELLTQRNWLHVDDFENALESALGVAIEDASS